MRYHVQALLIGGGVVGASMFYHFARYGWKDIALIERRDRTAGSTWRAARNGQFRSVRRMISTPSKGCLVELLLPPSLA